MSDKVILVPKDTFVVEHNGETVFMRKGITRVREGHPVTEGREDMFEPMTVDYDDVEQATAAPGEKRTGVNRSAKATAPAKGDDSKSAKG